MGGKFIHRLTRAAAVLLVSVVAVDGFSGVDWKASQSRRRSAQSSSSSSSSRSSSIPSQLFSTVGDDGESASGRSIGDVVQGLHGSKYQFGDAGINYEGQRFAEMSYASGDVVQEDNYEEEPIPNWAIRRLEKEQSIQTRTTTFEEVILENSRSSTSVTIQNDERSWEKYYGFVIGKDPSSYEIKPKVGMLAPRGGSGGFSDAATITVKCAKAPGDGGHEEDDDAWLLLCTEAETWMYKLR